MLVEAQEIESWLLERAAEVLRIPAEEIDPSRPLIDQGLDSLGAIELGQALETELGVALPAGGRYLSLTPSAASGSSIACIPRTRPITCPP